LKTFSEERHYYYSHISIHFWFKCGGANNPNNVSSDISLSNWFKDSRNPGDEVPKFKSDWSIPAPI
jgi:hypothetical protein